MKIVTYFSLLLLATMPVLAIEKNSPEKQKKQVCQDRKEQTSQKEQVDCSQGTQFICQKTVGSKGMVITKPGQYCLIEDIHFCPKNNRDYAITIAASDVVLNLNGRRLVQTNNKSHTIGVFVEPRQTGIQILNGVIENFGALGIWASTGVKGITLDALTIVGCGNRGRAPYATQDSFQEGGLGFFAGSVGLGGTSNTKDRISEVLIRNCTFGNTTNQETTAFDPVSRTQVGIIAVGIGATSTDTLTVQNSTTENITSTQSTARGITLTDGVTANITGHHASAIIHDQGGTAILLSKVTSGLVANAHVDLVQGLGGIVLAQRGSIGIGAVNSNNICVQNCFVTRAINSSTTGIALGILLRSTLNGSVSGSKVFNCSGTQQQTLVAGIIYQTDIDTTNPLTADRGTFITSCESSGNTNSNGNAYGVVVTSFRSQADPQSPIVEKGAPRAVVVDQCIAENNSTAGFWFHNASSCSLINSLTKNNTHVGILFDETSAVITPPVANSIENNVIETNGGFVSDAGVKDLYTSVRNMYIGNKAFNNTTQNYFGVVATTPMVRWNVPASAPTGDVNQKFANLDAQSH